MGKKNSGPQVQPLKESRLEDLKADEVQKMPRLFCRHLHVQLVNMLLFEIEDRAV